MKGILFKPDMIEAIAEGRKTQTRRKIWLQPSECNWNRTIDEYKEATIEGIGFNRRYQVGDVVYIKEAWWEDSGDIYFKMDFPNGELPTNMFFEKGEWKSPMFMPAWAARYFIRITNVRAERLQEIPSPDIHSEGLPDIANCATPLQWFISTWDSINKSPYDWDSNPWVWVYSFKKEDDKWQK